MAVGVFHGTVFEKITNLLIELGVSRGIVVQGMEGSEDLSVDKRTRTYLIQEGASELFIVDPEIYELMVEVPELNGRLNCKEKPHCPFFAEKLQLPYLNMVLLNSAVRLWVSQKAGSIEEGIYMARHAIEQGAAFRNIPNGRKRLNLYQQHK